MNDEKQQSSGLIISCLGDVAPVGKAEAFIEEVGVEAAADRLWKPVRGSDLIFLNLETALRTGSRAGGLFSRRTVAGLANNHIMDFGERGLIETIERLDAQGIPHAGAGRDLEAARQPAILELSGVRVGILCAADSRFQSAGTETAGVFPAKRDLLRESIGETARNCDAVVVSLHSGVEFSSYPFSEQIRIADTCLDAGAKLVIFHHAHCIGGQRSDARGLVLFGTGKYLFPFDHYVGNHWLTRRWIRRARRAAAWQVRVFAGRDAQVEAVSPLWIGDDGFPENPSPKESEHILKLIRRLSGRMSTGRLLPFWRMLDLLHPAFVGLNIRAYLELARCVGFKRMLSTAFDGLRAQLSGRGESGPS